MYSLEDVLSRFREEIVKSVGQEYSNLNIEFLNLLLVSDMRSFNMLSEDSMNITNTINTTNN